MHAAGVAMVLPEKGAANEKLDAKLPWMLRLRVTSRRLHWCTGDDRLNVFPRPELRRSERGGTLGKMHHVKEWLSL